MCIGLVYGIKYLQCICVFVSDGDQQITNAINQFTLLKLLNPKTRYRGCYWHGVTQVLLKTFSKDNEKACMVTDVLIAFMGVHSGFKRK